MSLAEVLATYRPAFGGETWETAIPDLLADADSAQRVDLLRAELVLTSGFTEPIVVDPQARELLDGMHRVAAALLSRHDWVDVADDVADLPEKRRVRVELGADPMSSAIVDRLDRVLRSFPFGGGWSTCDVLLPGDGQISGWWVCPAGLDEALGAELVERASREGIRLRLLSITYD
jgi:hypothetical protein